MNDMNVGPPARRETRRSIAQVLPSSPDNTGGYLAYPATDREGAPLGGMLEKLLRRWRLILAVFLGVAALGIGVTLLQTPSYSATALVMINPNPDQIVPDRRLSASRSDAATVDSEIEVMKSPWLAARLADELDLQHRSEWTGKKDKSANAAPNIQLARLDPSDDVAGVSNVVSSDASGSGAAPPPEAGIPPPPDVPDEVVAAVAEAIDIRRRGLSYVVEVTADAGSPRLAADMANGLANIYLKSLIEARFEASEKANGWLQKQLDELRLEVQRKQAAAQAYRAQRNLLTAQGVSLVETQVALVQSSLLQTRAQYAQRRAEYEMLSDISARGMSVAALTNVNDAMPDFRAKEAEVAQRIADLQSRYGPNHPALIQALEEKAALDTRIKDEMQRTAAKAKVEADALGARMRTEEAELASLRGELVSGNFDQVRLDALETDAETAQSVYENFLQRYHEVARQGTATEVGARILSPARPPASPTSPHLLLNGVLSIGAGLVLGLLAGLVAEQFRGAVETTEEVEQRAGARALVAIPSLKGRHLRNMPKLNRSPTSYLLAKRMSPFAEAFRVLQASILLANQPHRKVAAVTSAMPGEGKTTLSFGLARVAAMGGQRAIVVDCDIRMRAINKILGIDPQEGLQEVLSGERKWRDVVGCDQASGAHVLPASSLTSKDIFGNGAMEELIRELSAEYDLVVLDCAPIFAVADTRVIASLADAVVVVARSGKTPARALQAAISQLEIAGANVLGVALNGVDIQKGRRSFYDGLYYSKAFSGYYTRDA